MPTAYSSPSWGEGGAQRRIRGAYLALTLALFSTTASAASLVLPHERYGNKEGCAFLETGNMESDALQYLTREALSTYGSGCSFVSVQADEAGNQRAAGICGYEGEEMLGAEDFVVAAPLSSGQIKIYTASGETWGELEPCL